MKQRGAPSPCRLADTTNNAEIMLALAIGSGTSEKRLTSNHAWNPHAQLPSSLVEPTASMSYNARRLGEVADWVRQNMNKHLRSVARRHGGYHSYRYFAKPLVI